MLNMEQKKNRKNENIQEYNEKCIKGDTWYEQDEQNKSPKKEPHWQRQRIDIDQAHILSKK